VLLLLNLLLRCFSFVITSKANVIQLVLRVLHRSTIYRCNADARLVVPNATDPSPLAAALRSARKQDSRQNQCGPGCVPTRTDWWRTSLAACANDWHEKLLCIAQRMCHALHNSFSPLSTAVPLLPGPKSMSPSGCESFASMLVATAPSRAAGSPQAQTSWPQGACIENKYFHNPLCS